MCVLACERERERDTHTHTEREREKGKKSDTDLFPDHMHAPSSSRSATGKAFRLPQRLVSIVKEEGQEMKNLLSMSAQPHENEVEEIVMRDILSSSSSSTGAADAMDSSAMRKKKGKAVHSARLGLQSMEQEEDDDDEQALLESGLQPTQQQDLQGPANAASAITSNQVVSLAQKRNVKELSSYLRVVCIRLGFRDSHEPVHTSILPRC